MIRTRIIKLPLYRMVCSPVGVYRITEKQVNGKWKTISKVLLRKEPSTSKLCRLFHRGHRFKKHRLKPKVKLLHNTGKEKAKVREIIRKYYESLMTTTHKVKATAQKTPTGKSTKSVQRTFNQEEMTKALQASLIPAAVLPALVMGGILYLIRRK